MVFFRESDQFFALIQVDLQASDYRQGVASSEGKLIMPAGMKRAIARDFDTRTSTVRYID